jgi:mono/diheme cytochrome c family protein
MPDRRRDFGVVHLWILGCAMVLCSAALGQAQAPAPAQNTVQLNEGRELFSTYCASCHGVTGVGNGPAAASMRRIPPDITGLALQNGGMFPAERIGRVIDGRDIESHGDREMPVWGDAFKALQGGHTEEVVRGRIASIVKYLASIQRQRT